MQAALSHPIALTLVSLPSHLLPGKILKQRCRLRFSGRWCSDCVQSLVWSWGQVEEVIHQLHTDSRLNFPPSAAWIAALVCRSSWSPMDGAPERANTWEHQGWGVAQEERLLVGGGGGPRLFLKMWMYRSFDNKTTLNTLLAHENVDNLAEGGNEFRISLVLPAQICIDSQSWELASFETALKTPKFCFPLKGWNIQNWFSKNLWAIEILGTTPTISFASGV